MSEPETGMSPEAEAASAAIREYLGSEEVPWTEERPGLFYLELPGERKLKTPVRLEVGNHALTVQAFVCRRPDENHAAVYRWMLERNMRMFAMSFAVDAVGDLFLGARLPLAGVTVGELDRLLGSVLSYADESFNVLLELGFASAIRKEYQWRIANGESTRNLDAFKGWLEAEEAAAD